MIESFITDRGSHFFGQGNISHFIKFINFLTKELGYISKEDLKIIFNERAVLNIPSQIREQYPNLFKPLFYEVEKSSQNDLITLNNILKTTAASNWDLIRNIDDFLKKQEGIKNPLEKKIKISDRDLELIFNYNELNDNEVDKWVDFKYSIIHKNYKMLIRICKNSTDFENRIKELIAFREALENYKESCSDEWVKIITNRIDHLIQTKISQKKLDFDKIKDSAKKYIQVPFFASTDLIASLNKSLNNPHSPHYLKDLFESTKNLKRHILDEIFPSKTRCVSDEYLISSLDLIEKIETAIAQEADKLPNHTEKMELLKSVAMEQGLDFSEDFQNGWVQKSKEMLQEYSQVRKNILNSTFLLDQLKEKGITLNQAVQLVFTHLNTGTIEVLDRFFTKGKEETKLLGYATQPANLIGRMRFVESDVNFKAAQPGEILVIRNASPDIHLYSKAAAIIAEQGGLFSHAAITFSHLKIPALLGCSIETLKSYDGKFIHLNLNEDPSFQVLSDEIAEKIEFEAENLEAASKIEMLPKEIGLIISRQFYKNIFNNFSPQEFFPFLKYPYAKAYIDEEREEIKLLKKRLWAAENSLESNHLAGKLRRKINQIRKIVELDPQAEISSVIEAEILQTERELASLNLNQKGFGKSGKKENLDRLNDLLPSIKLNKLRLNIPKYVSFTAKNLVWDVYPEIKTQIKEIIKQNSPVSEKSRQIHDLISHIQLDQAVLLSSIPLEGELIVRSSAKLEDQCQNAAAGIFESFKTADPEKIADDFLRVLSSAFSEKALTMFASPENDQSDLLFEMTWIVQEYVKEGKYSGVAFSVANENDWNVMGMQLVQGFGGGVDGTQIPTHAFLHKQEQTFVDLQSSNESIEVCNCETMKEIASLMRQLENFCNAPVEIEFAGNENDLSIVQLRPIAF